MLPTTRFRRRLKAQESGLAPDRVATKKRSAEGTHPPGHVDVKRPKKTAAQVQKANSQPPVETQSSLPPPLTSKITAPKKEVIEPFPKPEEPKENYQVVQCIVLPQSSSSEQPLLAYRGRSRSPSIASRSGRTDQLDPTKSIHILKSFERLRKTSRSPSPPPCVPKHHNDDDDEEGCLTCRRRLQMAKAETMSKMSPHVTIKLLNMDFLESWCTRPKKSVSFNVEPSVINAAFKEDDCHLKKSVAADRVQCSAPLEADNVFDAKSPKNSNFASDEAMDEDTSETEESGVEDSPPPSETSPVQVSDSESLDDAEESDPGSTLPPQLAFLNLAASYFRVHLSAHPEWRAVDGPLASKYIDVVTYLSDQCFEKGLISRRIVKEFLGLRNTVPTLQEELEWLGNTAVRVLLDGGIALHIEMEFIEHVKGVLRLINGRDSSFTRTNRFERRKPAERKSVPTNNPGGVYAMRRGRGYYKL